MKIARSFAARAGSTQPRMAGARTFVFASHLGPATPGLPHERIFLRPSVPSCTTLLSDGFLILGRCYATDSKQTIEFILAARQGDVAVLKNMTKKNSELVNTIDYDLRSPLHLAARQGQIEAAQFLIENGADINAVDRFGSTPLAEAAAGEHQDMINLLKEKGADESSLIPRISPAIDLVTAASAGDLHRVQQLVEKAGVSPSATDYDNRSALHLAAAEGHLDVVKYLVEQGAQVNSEDRWGGTPMFDAVKNSHDDVALYLRSLGYEVRVDKSLITAIMAAAAQDDVLSLDRLIPRGLAASIMDSVGRTPLHIAVMNGSKKAVDFLLQRGANVNAIDSYGHTALSEALKGDSKRKREMVKTLEHHGAVADSDLQHAIFTPEVRRSIIQSMPLLCARGNFVYSEIWVPSDDGTDLLPLPEWYAVKERASLFGRFHPLVADTHFEPATGLPGRAYVTMSPVGLEEISPESLGIHATLLRDYDIKSGVALPICYQSNVLAVLLLFSDQPESMDQNELKAFSNYANGLVSSGILRTDTTVFADIPGISPEKMRAVYEMIVSEGVFNAKHIYQEVDWFYRMGVPSIYYELFDSQVIANHIHSLIAAKKLAQAMGSPEKIFVHTENPDSHFFIVPATYADSKLVETQIEQIIEQIPEKYAFSLTYMCSEGTTLPNGKHQLSMYVIDTSPYLDPNAGPDESSIWKISSGTFLRDKTYEIRTRYQQLINESVNNINPLFKIHERSQDGSTPVTLTFRHDQRASFLLNFTEVLKLHKIRCSRKFIQSFANGLIVYTFYLDSTDMNVIHAFINDIKLMSLVPGSSMRQLFLRGSLSVEEYAYAASVRKFIYYFLNQRDEEFDVLAQALASDSANLGRLNMLSTRLRREAVSPTRITQAMFDEVSLLKELYADFYRVCYSQEAPTYNHELAQRITKLAKSEINKQILHAFLTFNSHLLKTNFWKSEKAALSFSLDASFVEAASYPENPYVIFFVLTEEFQGFHVRFRDVSRGGIRVIKSANKTTFIKNLEGQFSENYDLALTQNRKNKDIPEFGSKGTILLHKEAQENVHLAFKKYVSAILDLLVFGPEDNIIDHYKKPELLFLGPDENSADLMEWAARYAQTRKYSYWKAFTTGKPPSLGGVPHDTYGMTTASVHSYVVGIYTKLGLREEEVTKFQTGGPDGDLGSNEILVSNDKTTAIVDGSGVIYDPAGLNRTELRRLAQTRKMISSFDLSLLSPEGFRVLVTDIDIVLPNGEKVESGLSFRNEFHLHPLSKADIFVPCGGRPASINLHNVGKLIDKNGVPKYKYIVEGANLFLTQDARVVLEKAGVVLYKDASANKGGVTSSSLEVLAALSMPDELHEEHMQVKDPNNVPKFYQDYVKEVIDIIRNNAYMEFECIWREHERTGIARCILTDRVSMKINQLNDIVSASALYDDPKMRNAVLTRAIPKNLQALLGLTKILEVVPDNYARAIFSAHLASHYVYKYGIEPHDFAFYEFIKSYDQVTPADI